MARLVVKLKRICSYEWYCPKCKAINLDDPLDNLKMVQCDRCLKIFSSIQVDNECKKK